MTKSIKSIFHTYAPYDGSTSQTMPLSYKYLEIVCPKEDQTQQSGGGQMRDILVTGDTPETIQTFLKNTVGEDHFTANPNICDIQLGNNAKAIFYSTCGFDKNKQMLDLFIANKHMFLVVISHDEEATIQVIEELEENVGRIYGSDNPVSKNICVIPMDGSINVNRWEENFAGKGITVLKNVSEIDQKLSSVKTGATTTNANVDNNVDILVLGDCRVGKTTLISRLMGEKKQVKYVQTRNYLNRTSVFKLNGSDYSLKFIDTPGNLKEIAGFNPERDKGKIEEATVDQTISSLSIKGLMSTGAIYVVFDLTSYDSYLYALALINKIKLQNPKIKVITFANKGNLAEEFKVSFDVSGIKKVSNLYYDTNFLDLTEMQIFRIKMKTVRYFKVLDGLLSKPGHTIDGVNKEFNILFGQKKEKKMIVKMENGRIHYGESAKDLEKKKDKNIITMNHTLKLEEVELKKKAKKDSDAPGKQIELIVDDGSEPYIMKGKSEDEQTQFKTFVYRNQVMWDCVEAWKSSILKFLICENASKISKTMGKQAEEVTKHFESIYEFERVDRSRITIDLNAMQQMQNSAPSLAASGKGEKKEKEKDKDKKKDKEKDKKDKKKK